MSRSGQLLRFEAVLATRDREQERRYAFRDPDPRPRQRFLARLAEEGIEPRLEED